MLKQTALVPFMTASLGLCETIEGYRMALTRAGRHVSVTADTMLEKFPFPTDQFIERDMSVFKVRPEDIGLVIGGDFREDFCARVLVDGFELFTIESTLATLLAIDAQEEGSVLTVCMTALSTLGAPGVFTIDTYRTGPCLNWRVLTPDAVVRPGDEFLLLGPE